MQPPSLLLIVLLGAVVFGQAAEDPYLRYVREAPEFQSVPQDAKLLSSRWNTWIYMPWRYQWGIGTEEAGGQFCQQTGINGGFADHGEGPLAWMEKWHLRFYNDHTANKGFLYLRGANDLKNFTRYQRDPQAVRAGSDGPQPVDAALLEKLRPIITRNIANLKKSPMRVAYALDDEISWGAFVMPLPWRINSDDAAYARWLDSYYGGPHAPPQYVTPDFILPQLSKPLRELDFSPLLDRITYQDSVWANFLGDLVRCANQADPETPCGFVGGQAPNLWGGYDYAKLMKKVQFIEAYDMGSSQAVIRSLQPNNTIPQVTTHFHDDKAGTARDVWQSWYYFAHGNRGMIGWVEGWFDGVTPRPWLAEFAPTLKELGEKQGPKLAGAKWRHDGIAIYYSHPSIQVSWCLDMEAHGRTWVNRNNDHKLGTSHGVRRAWEDMLTDDGLQYDFLSYDRLVREGVPKEYRVLVLPACYALSDIEAARITAFCRNGGTVVADFACGLFDQHGKGRTRGALDELFAVKHDGSEKKTDFFAGKLWVETDQDAGYGAKDWKSLLGTLECRLEDGFAVAERSQATRRQRAFGNGQAVYLNLSPLRYRQSREEGTTTDGQRDIFLKAIRQACPNWVTVSGPDGKRPRDLETTCWRRGNRTILFVMRKLDPEKFPEAGKGTPVAGESVPVTIRFARPINDVRDERNDRVLGDGSSFTVTFPANEAAMMSFRD